MPNEDWLNFVVTAKARSVIKQSLKEDKKKIATEGKDSLERKLKSLKIEISESNILLLMNYYKVISPLDLYFSIANRKIDLSELARFDVVGGKIKLLNQSIPHLLIIWMRRLANPAKKRRAIDNGRNCRAD